MIEFTGRIDTSFPGFLKIIRLYDDMEKSEGRENNVDFSRIIWIDANMCAPLRAVLHKLQAKGMQIGINERMDPKVQEIMQKNSFLTDFGWKKVKDLNNTVYDCVRYKNDESSLFDEYISSNFYRGGKGLPDMTPRLLNAFRESISEIFQNAVQHAESDLGIFACGQFFPVKRRLDFAIVDLGIGFRKRILKMRNLDFTPVEAIIWAIEKFNTTRTVTGKKPGGHGLKLIKDFIRLNKGRMIIVSEGGYFELGPDFTERKRLDPSFPGTVVIIEINTADTHAYCLSDELPIDGFSW